MEKKIAELTDFMANASSEVYQFLAPQFTALVTADGGWDSVTNATIKQLYTLVEIALAIV